VEAAHSLARWDNGPLGQFYARKAPGVGARKAIIALARKLLIVAWRMLVAGEVYRAAQPTVVARKQREAAKGRSGFSYQQRCRLSLLRATPGGQPHPPEARRV
jgi:hypothetical protein